MRILPITELLRLTRSELLNLQARIIGALTTIPVNSPDYDVAMINLRKVTEILSRPAAPSPRRFSRQPLGLSGRDNHQ